MFSNKYIFLFWALLGLVVASRPQQRKSWVIIHQLDLLQTETRQLNVALDTWDKTLMGAVGVSEQTEKVLQVTKNATATILTDSQGLGLLGALHVKSHIDSLTKDIRASIGHIGVLKEDFKKVGLAQTVLNSLLAQQTASKELNDAIVPKIPWIGRPIARGLGRKVNKIFQGTIDEYKKILAEESESMPQKIEMVSSSEDERALDNPTRESCDEH